MPQSWQDGAGFRAGKSVTKPRIFSISIDMRKAASAIGLGVLICAGCGKQPDAVETVRYARGHSLSDLVFAVNAPIFDAGGIPYAEAVWTDGIWKIHDDGAWRADCRNEGEVHQIMRQVWEKRPKSRVLISAGGSTTFLEIWEMVSGAARAGFRSMDFLVATGASKGASHSIRHFLMYGCESPPDIEPVMMVVDAQGNVFNGTGASQFLLDSRAANHSLPRLDAMLKVFSAAAKAANSRPFLHVYADPAVNYQRVIDVLARCHEHGVDIIFNDLDPSMDQEPINRPELLKTIPRPPWSQPPQAPDE